MAKALPPVVVKPLDGKNIEIKLRRVPISFVEVFEPVQGSDDKGNPTDRFYLSTSILLDKDTEAGKAQTAAIRQGMKDARAAEWGDEKVSIGAQALCLQDGEPIDPDTIEYDADEKPIPGTGTRVARWAGYEGRMYVSANKPIGTKTSKPKTMEEARAILRDNNPVQILGPRKTAQDRNGTPIFPTLTDKDGLIYSGAICDVIIKIYPYNGTGKGGNGKNHPHRINASLEAIKFVEHGVRFGGGKPVDAQNAFDEEEDEDGADAPATGGATSQPDPMDDPLG